MRVDVRRWIRFIAGGLLNTAVTYGLYLGLNRFLPYAVAYLIAYAIGIVIAYAFNARFVFRTPLSVSGFATYPLVYVAQYALSTGLLAVCVELAEISETIAPLLVLVAMVPISYVLNRFALGGRGSGSQNPSA